MGLKKGMIHKGSFKPGNKAARHKKIPGDLKAVLNESYDIFCKTIIGLMNMTLSDIKKLDKTKLPLIERTIITAFTRHNYAAIDKLLNRLWGKPPESFRFIDIDGNDRNNPVLMISEDFLPNCMGEIEDEN